MPTRSLVFLALLIFPGASAQGQGIEQRRDTLMRQLADCETGGKGAAGWGRGPYIGAFQFEPGTVIGFVRERDGRTLTVPEAIALASDYDRASALAEYVIFARDGHGHWPACGRKLGIARQVAEIRSSDQLPRR